MGGENRPIIAQRLPLVEIVKAEVDIDSEIAVSVLSRFELLRISLRKGIPWDQIDSPLARSTALIEVTGEAADEAARISVGTGMPAIDALILAGLVLAGCRTIYTRDDHFMRYDRKGVEIVILD